MHTCLVFLSFHNYLTTFLFSNRNCTLVWNLQSALSLKRLWRCRNVCLCVCVCVVVVFSSYFFLSLILFFVISWDHLSQRFPQRYDWGLALFLLLVWSAPALFFFHLSFACVRNQTSSWWGWKCNVKEYVYGTYTRREPEAHTKTTPIRSTK